MKKLLLIVGLICAALPAYAETVKCYIGNFSWTMNAYDGTSLVATETESSTDADPTGNVKGGYKYQTDDNGYGPYSCYYNSELYYDLSSLYNLGDIVITNAQIVVYVTDVSTTLTDESAYPTLSHVLDSGTLSVGTLESATNDSLNYIDVTSLVNADYAAAVTSSSYTLTSGSIAAGTSGTNYAKLDLVNDSGVYGTDTESYILVTYSTVPEPSTVALLGVLAVGCGVWKCRGRKGRD